MRSRAASSSLRPRGLAAPELTFPQLWAFLAVALPVLAGLIAPMSTIDLAYQVRTGDLIVAARAMPAGDPFTFTAAGSAWLDQQWGAQLVLSAAFALGGWAGLAVLRAALIGLTFWFVQRACRSAGAGVRIAAWLSLAAFIVSLTALGLRPQLFGMLLFAITLAVLAERHARPRLALVLPVLVVAWANLHGSFVLGPLAIGVAWLDDVLAGRAGWRGLLGLAVVAGLATLVNPYGPGAWSYAAGITTNSTIRRLITEWQPVDPLSVPGALFIGSLAVAVVILAAGWRSRRRVSLPALAWLVVLAGLGLSAQRGVAWWALAAPIALVPAVASVPSIALGRAPVDLVGPHPESAGDAPARGSRANRGTRANGLIAALLVVAIVVLLPQWRGGDRLVGAPGLLSDAPAGLTRAVLATARLTDRIWNAQRWGSWLEWAVPGVPVAVDSRIEVIPEDAWSDHLALSHGDPSWAAILDRRGVTIVVAGAEEQAGLIPLLAASPDWRLVDRDADGAVFVRSAGR